MKTVYTTLPIYKALADQCYQRGLANGSTIFAPVYTPRHRLPSFMWIDNGDGAATVSTIYLVDSEGVAVNITSYFVTLPVLYTSTAGDDYFIYNGDTLNYALPTGAYYLKIVMNTNHVYFSDWFLVDCVYAKFAEEFVNNTFDTFTVYETTISACVDAGAAAYALSSPVRTVYLGQVLTVIFYLTTSGATTPQFSVVSTSLGVISNVATSAAGLNELTLTTTAAADDCYIRIQTAGTCNFSTTEILVYKQFSDDWITLSFSNCCNVGDILYEDDFLQTLWLKTDNIEQSYPYTEKGQENGLGRFVPTFRRQDKTYLIRTDKVPQFLIDVFHRLKLHDVATFIDQVGDAFTIEAVDVEHEWQFDRYYATANITLDLGEGIVQMGCCQ